METCSPYVKKGLHYLINEINEGKIECRSHNSLIFYLIKDVEPSLLNIFSEAAKKDSFWDDDWISENPYEACFIIKLGFVRNKFIQKIIYEKEIYQTIGGEFILTSIFDHCDDLLLMGLVNPESDAVKKGVQYFINQWKEGYDFFHDFGIGELAIGIIALSEINFYKYEKTIREMCEGLKKTQNEEGFFDGSEKDDKSWSKVFRISVTSVCIIALSRVFGVEDESVKKAVAALKKIQSENGSFDNGSFDGKPDHLRCNDTAYALLALITVGEGPKKSISLLDWEENLQLKKIQYMKPYFLQTSPITKSKIPIKEVHDKIREMIRSAESEIKITSLYIDSMYEDLIEKCEKNPSISVKVVCRHGSDIKGARARIARNVIDLLNIATKDNVRKNELLHSRIIIADNKEIIVSSVDLTRDQLFDEFNAAIYTRDKEVIDNANSYFENLWENSEKISS